MWGFRMRKGTGTQEERTLSSNQTLSRKTERDTIARVPSLYRCLIAQFTGRIEAGEA
jgi:hypothetical protein